MNDPRDRRVADDSQVPTIVVFYGIIAVMAFTIAAVVAVFVFGEGDSTPVITTIVGLSAPTIGTLLILLRIDRVQRVTTATHDSIQQANGTVPRKLDEVAAKVDDLAGKVDGGAG